MRYAYALFLFCGVAFGQTTQPQQVPLIGNRVLGNGRIVGPPPAPDKTKLEPQKQLPEKSIGISGGKLKLSTPTGAIAGGTCAGNNLYIGSDTYGNPKCVPVTGIVSVSASGTNTLSVNSNASGIVFTLNITGVSGSGTGATAQTIILQDTADSNCYQVVAANGILGDQPATCTGAVPSYLFKDSSGAIYALTTRYGVFQNSPSSGTGNNSLVIADTAGGTTSLSSASGTLQTTH